MTVRGMKSLFTKNRERDPDGMKRDRAPSCMLLDQHRVATEGKKPAQNLLRFTRKILYIMHFFLAIEGKWGKESMSARKK